MSDTAIAFWSVILVLLLLLLPLIVLAIIVLCCIQFVRYLKRKIVIPKGQPQTRQPAHRYDTRDPFNRPPNYPLPPSQDQWLPQGRNLNVDEMALIDMYRMATPELRNYVTETLKRERAIRNRR